MEGKPRMVSKSEIQAEFNREVAHGEMLNLARAALLYAQYLGQEFDRPQYLTALDELAAAVRSEVRLATSDWTTLEYLSRFLFEDLNFRGNEHFYYQPENSFLNQVLDLRLGIPITLSVVYLEVAWRLNLPLYGVNAPGHFLIGYQGAGKLLYIDAFNGGRILTEEACLASFNVSAFDKARFLTEALQPANRLDILLRMLNNLKHIYLRHETWTKAYDVLDLMLIVRPDLPESRLERGLLAARMNNYPQAIDDLRFALQAMPDLPNRDELEDHVAHMEKTLSRLN